MEIFADDRPIGRSAGQHPRGAGPCAQRGREPASPGTAAFVERYDPSLPSVLGHRDLLIQLFLNLVKNAAEATDNEIGNDHSGDAYQHGVRVAAPGGAAPGRPAARASASRTTARASPRSIRPHLFDPFVTTKPDGKGLGLALVAKIVARPRRHHRMSQQRAGRTHFDVLLAASPPAERLTMAAPPPSWSPTTTAPSAPS